MIRLSNKVRTLKQSGIRSASVQCAAVKGINLGQGVCDLPVPEAIKRAAHDAIEHNKSMYSACEGVFELRQKITEKISQFNNMHVDPTTEVVVTHGATAAFVCAVMTLFDPGDEVILFEPFYGYHKNILNLHQISVKSVPLCIDDLSFCLEDLTNAITEKTKGIVICSPNNPTGKVFSSEELLSIGRIANQHGLSVITDEIYEYITYPGYEHISFAALENFWEFTVTISGFSKTYNMTGWRLGYATGPAEVIEKMALVHDLQYVCPVTPLQHAVIAALSFSGSYYQEMQASYLSKRDNMVASLRQLGYQVTEPQGAYYLLADIRHLQQENAEQAAAWMLEKAKVAVVPGTAFYNNPADGDNVVRFCYALSEEKINQALQQLAKLC